ncbi:MAG TPA: TrmH family RNA methyltransferase [Mariniphaga anaerophila]|uniref:tRNA (guanosine(18)-2'-O)-methyltransferase n=1 Tax=Mariniphaga anaerophila TaxID=1484053 RepID=A0A831PPI3_9BACT|nr:TrmH family RNA methyltransferase [Mariniphaga anaerophila]
MQKQLIKHLSEFATPERLNLFEKVLEQRTEYITVVLEDIFQPQNASAVLRTCDCFGIQHVHVIENRNEFTIDREVALGASKWLNIHKYNRKKKNSLEAIQTLKNKGYRIVATTPHLHDQLLPDFDMQKGKVAVVFGSELPGVSETIKNEADEFLKIPMVGFTESFNISVSAAIVLYQLTKMMKKSPGLSWQLTDEEKDSILLQWLRTTIKRSSLLEQHFRKEHGMR